jgi:hypothetical protein
MREEGGGRKEERGEERGGIQMKDFAVSDFSIYRENSG